MQASQVQQGQLAPGSRDYYFVIVGRNDQPLFEMEFPVVGDPRKRKQPDVRHLNQFVAHSALDVVDEVAGREPHMYFKVWFGP
jgi:hypothetical protein